MPHITLEQLIELDENDPLKEKRALFELEDDLIYLDGNSLGALPKQVSQTVQTVIQQQWGQDLITSWNKHQWVRKSAQVGDMIAPLVGAAAGTIKVGDSTSINVFKALSSAFLYQESKQDTHPVKPRKKRNVILSDTTNFPTDLYMAQGLSQLLGTERCIVKLVEEQEIETAIDETVAVVLLTHVNFRSGRMYDMEAITRHAHKQGALIIWDLAHSAGAVPIHLQKANVDFAIGCGYKYLNGGPGAPAFIYVANHIQAASTHALTGWFGHQAPFDFSAEYIPAPSQERFNVGTPAILSLTALEAALRLWDDIDMQQIRKKSSLLGDLFIQIIEQECFEFGFTLASPRHPEDRGSQISLAHENGYAIMQALIADKVIGDFRAPNLLRFGFTPLYTRYQDIWEAVQRLKNIMQTERYNNPAFHKKSTVT